MSTACSVLLFAVICVFDTWVATWGQACSLKTSPMCFREIVIYANCDLSLFSMAPSLPPPRPVGVCPSFLKLLSHRKDPSGVRCEFPPQSSV